MATAHRQSLRGSRHLTAVFTQLTILTKNSQRLTETHKKTSKISVTCLVLVLVLVLVLESGRLSETAEGRAK